MDFGIACVLSRHAVREIATSLDYTKLHDGFTVGLGGVF